MKKFKNVAEKLGKKKVITIGAVMLLAVGGVGYKVYADTQYQKEVDQAIVATMKQTDQFNSLTKEFLDFYEEQDTKGYLKKDLTQKEIDSYQAKLSKEWVLTDKPLKSDELDKATEKATAIKKSVETDVQALQAQFDNQEKVNALFQKEQAINGSTVKADLVIVDDLKQEGGVTIPKDDTTKWADSMRQILTNVTNQLNQIKKATEQVDKLFKDNKVIEKVDEKVLKSAQDEVKAIRNEKAKKAQEARLKQVTDEVAKRKKAEEKAKAEKTASDIGETVVDDGKGNVKVVDSSGAELTQSGNGDTATWTPQPTDNGGNGQGNTGSDQSTGNGNNWTPPANNGGGNTGGGNYTPPATGNGGGGQTPPVPETPVAPPVVDNSPVNLGNSGIFASTAGEANSQAYALWASGQFTQYQDFVARPAVNASGSVVGYTVDFV